MIGERIRANASYPIRSPTTVAYLILAFLIVLFYAGGFVVASSL
jgi:hypothetical protein